MDFDISQSPAAYAILGLILVVSVLAFNNEQLLRKNLLRPYWMLKNKEYAPVVTCGFIHGDAFHLLFNAITLWSFGTLLEQMIGTGMFVALYFIGLVLSSLGTVYKQRNNPDYAALGASGAVLAVLFAGIVYFPMMQIGMFFLPIRIPAVLYAVLYLAYTWWASKGRADGIAHDAHLDGALTGMLFVAITDYEQWTLFMRYVMSGEWF
jgi:membrane associated rhomboid family serine protease